MCNPQQTGALAVGGQAFGVGMETVGSYYAAKAEKASLEGQAALADINAQMSETAAQVALRKGQQEGQQVQLKSAALKGQQRASLAASGVDLGSGSAVNILTTTDVLKEMDVNQINANAVREAWGYRTEGTNYANKALLTRASAKGINPLMAAGRTLITGASAVAKSKYEWDKVAKDTQPSTKPGTFFTLAEQQRWGGT